MQLVTSLLEGGAGLPEEVGTWTEVCFPNVWAGLGLPALLDAAGLPISLGHANHELFSFPLCSSCLPGSTTGSLSHELGMDVGWWEAGLWGRSVSWS